MLCCFDWEPARSTSILGMGMLADPDRLSCLRNPKGVFPPTRKYVPPTQDSCAARPEIAAACNSIWGCLQNRCTPLSQRQVRGAGNERSRRRRVFTRGRGWSLPGELAGRVQADSNHDCEGGVMAATQTAPAKELDATRRSATACRFEQAECGLLAFQAAGHRASAASAIYCSSIGVMGKSLVFLRVAEKCSGGRKIDFPVLDAGQRMTAEARV